jgi:hypothetical protein
MKINSDQVKENEITMGVTYLIIAVIFIIANLLISSISKRHRNITSVLRFSSAFRISVLLSILVLVITYWISLNYKTLLLMILTNVIWMTLFTILIYFIMVSIYAYIHIAEKIDVSATGVQIVYESKKATNIPFDGLQFIIVQPLGGGAFQFLFQARSKKQTVVLSGPEPTYSCWLYPMLNDLSGKCEVYWSYGLLKKRKKWYHTDPEEV